MTTTDTTPATTGAAQAGKQLKTNPDSAWRRGKEIAQAYVRRIRNDRKQAYAEAYLAYTLGETDNYPNTEDFALSYMAAQGVRLSINQSVEAR